MNMMEGLFEGAISFIKGAAHFGEKNLYKSIVKEKGARITEDIAAGIEYSKYAQKKYGRFRGGLLSADRAIGDTVDSVVNAAMLPFHLTMAAAGKGFQGLTGLMAKAGVDTAGLLGKAAIKVGKNTIRNAPGMAKFGYDIGAGVAKEAVELGKYGYQVGRGVNAVRKSRVAQIGLGATVGGVATTTMYQRGQMEVDMGAKLGNSSVSKNGGNTFLYDQTVNSAIDDHGASGNLVFALHTLRGGEAKHG